VGNEYVAPQTRTEEVLAQAWGEVLKLDRVGIHDNFFDLGGDSIRSIRALGKAQEKNVTFTVENLFLYPTIHELARAIDASEPAIERPRQVEPLSLISQEDRQRLPAGVEDAYPLTRMQAGMIFHTDYSTHTQPYHDLFSFLLRLPWDHSALRQSLALLASRHALLRTAFELSAFSEPLQLVYSDVVLPLTMSDLRLLPHDTQQLEIKAAIAEELAGRFLWSQPPLIRFRVLRLSDETWHLICVFHHAILDGWSFSLLLTELFQHYRAVLKQEPSPLPPPPQLAYRHFVALELEALRSEEAREFWRQRMTAAPRWRLPRWPAAAKGAGSRQLVINLGAELGRELSAVARSEGVSLKTVLLAAHLRVLSRLSGQREVLSGVVTHGRPAGSDSERMIGMFLNTLPLRLKLRGGTWRRLVRETSEAERELLAHRHYPLAEILRETGGGELFEIVFNYTHFYGYEEWERGSEELRVEEEGGVGATNYPLMVDFNVEHRSREPRLILSWDAGQVSVAQAQWIGELYQRTLRALSVDVEGNYGEGEVVGAERRHQQLVEWNDGGVSGVVERGVEELFAEQVRSRPDAVAVSRGEESLSYGELERRANQVAWSLRRLGVRGEEVVGVCLERSLELTQGVMGVIKAGGIYLALEVGLPDERMRSQLRDGGVRVVITKQRWMEKLAGVEVQAVCLDGGGEESGKECEEWEREERGAGRALYLIYTSGSTGEPKGVIGVERGTINRCEWMWEEYGFEEGEVVCQKTPVGFVDGVWEQLGGLLQGVRTEILREEEVKDVRELMRVLRERGVTRMVVVPSLLRAVMEEARRRGSGGSGVKLWVSSGEELREELRREFEELERGSRLLNLYGSSEVSADVSCWDGKRAGQWERVGIGRPISGTELYVVDEQGEVAEVGARGEIYVGGKGVGRGYWGRADETAERFVPDPYSGRRGERLYRTGDVGRYGLGGELEYVGRGDRQLKVRGYRVELGEIEKELRRCRGVREAVVKEQEEEPGMKELVAYVEREEGEESGAVVWRRELRERLPEYEIPGRYVVVKQWPMNGSGKVDRAALGEGSEGEEEEVREKYEGAGNVVEEMLVEIWEEVLGRERIGIHDNFFDLGGHSLLAMLVVGRIQEKTLIDLPVKALFDSPTIAELAELLGSFASEPQQNQERLLETLRMMEHLSDEEAMDILVKRKDSTD